MNTFYLSDVANRWTITISSLIASMYLRMNTHMRMGRNIERLRNCFLNSYPSVIGSAIGIAVSFLLQWIDVI